MHSGPGPVYMEQRSHNLRKFPQIYAVSTVVVLVVMRILCIFFSKVYCCLNPNHPLLVETRICKITCESADMESSPSVAR